MKIYNYSGQTLIWMTACLLFLTMDDKSQATRSDTESRHAGASEISAQPVGGDARLLVRRIPNLGNNVIVDLYIDGAAVRPIVYGQTYEGFMPAGRHVLSVVASPHA